MLYKAVGQHNIKEEEAWHGVRPPMQVRVAITYVFAYVAISDLRLV
jgi:hypothetical protein